MAPEGGFIDKQVTNRCKGALVRSVLSSSVLLGPIGAVVAKWIESRTCNPKITGSSLMLGVWCLAQGSHLSLYLFVQAGIAGEGE